MIPLGGERPRNNRGLSLILGLALSCAAGAQEYPAKAVQVPSDALAQSGYGSADGPR